MSTRTSCIFHVWGYIAHIWLLKNKILGVGFSFIYNCMHGDYMLLCKILKGLFFSHEFFWVTCKELIFWLFLFLSLSSILHLFWTMWMWVTTSHVIQNHFLIYIFLRLQGPCAIIMHRWALDLNSHEKSFHILTSIFFFWWNFAMFWQRNWEDFECFFQL